MLTPGLCLTHHVEVPLVKATEDEKQVSTQLTEQLLPTHVLCKPFDHVTLRQEVPSTKQVLETTRHIFNTSTSSGDNLLALLIRVSIINSLALALTQNRNSGRTDILVMGLAVNATVATGAKPKNNLILLASSGSVENAMNAGK